MCQGQASLTELSFSSASSVVTKPPLSNDILMVKQTNKQTSERHNSALISLGVFQIGFAVFHYM